MLFVSTKICQTKFNFWDFNYKNILIRASDLNAAIHLKISFFQVAYHPNYDIFLVFLNFNIVDLSNIFYSLVENKTFKEIISLIITTIFNG